MAAFGVYEPTRAEQLREIAWIWLLYKTRKPGRNDPHIDAMHKRFLSLNLPDDSAFHDHSWDFCADLIDEALGLVNRREDGVTIRVCDEIRHRIAYEIIVCQTYIEGHRLGQNTKRYFMTLASQLKVEPTDMCAFSKMLIRDITRVVYTEDM